MQELKRKKITEFLRQIPGHTEDTLEVVNSSDSEVILAFLSFFNVLDIAQDGIRAKSESAKFFIESLALYIENELSLLSDWENSGTLELPDDEDILTYGINFLRLMENKRVRKLNIKDVLNDVEITTMIIKAYVTGSDEPRYLFQYNPKSLQFQMIGGYKKEEDTSDVNSIQRLITKELSLNSLVVGKDFTYKKALDDFVHYHVSSKKGAYTKYTVHNFFIHFTNPELTLKLQKSDRWLTLNEIESGMSKDGFVVLTPRSEDSTERSAVLTLLETLETSLQAKQSYTDKAIVQKVKIRNEITQYLGYEESVNLEFKSSVRWDYTRGNVNKDLEKVIVKTVCAFLNTNDGGTLLIGVSDEKEVLGIENDIKTLNKKNEDGFTQHIINLISTHIGSEFIPFVKIRFETAKSKTVCIINIEKSIRPVFIKESGEFYIRTENSSRLLTSAEVHNYIQMHW